MDISFVILTWNSEKYIEKCLSSIAVSFGRGSLTYEILIVDNGSKDDTITIIKNYKKKLPFELKLIILKRNMGTTYPRNLAITMARGLYLCVMDSDVELYPEVIEKLKSNLEKDPSIGLTVPKLLYPSGKLQKSIDEFPTVFRKAYRYFFLKQLEEKENRDYKSSPPQYVDYAISAVWFLKKDVMDRIGLLDEKIFYSPEDVDFCLRLWKSGLKILYDPTISAIHHTQEISKGFKLNSAFISHIKGLAYYFFKHRYFFRKPRYSQEKRSVYL